MLQQTFLKEKEFKLKIMSRRYFYLLLLTLCIIEIVQVLFVWKFLDWFKVHNGEFIYLMLFTMSITALGVMTYFLARGIYSVIKYKGK